MGASNEMKSKICKVCLAWHDYDDDSDRGECRIRAPLELDWPETYKDDWCLEWLELVDEETSTGLT